MSSNSKEYAVAYREANKEKLKEYQQKYYEQHKEKLRLRQKEYYEENKEDILQQYKQYNARPEVRDRNKANNVKYYAANRSQCLESTMRRRSEQKLLVEQIALHYGCQNPTCKWVGSFDPCQLDFHHLHDKKKNVSQMYGCKLEEIAAEINKCVVLCRNCHQLLHKDEEGMNLSGSTPCSVREDLTLILYVSGAGQQSQPSTSSGSSHRDAGEPPSTSSATPRPSPRTPQE